jgi:hypothetical protein
MKHYNPSITERANRILNLKNGDGMSEEIDGPVAVIPIEPACRIVRRQIRTTSGTSTIYTTPADKDFYLVSAQLDYMQDAASDGLFIELLARIDGIDQPLIAFRKLTLTASAKSAVYSPCLPVKIDRNTSIYVNHSYTVGNGTVVGCITGYTEEVTRT